LTEGLRRLIERVKSDWLALQFLGSEVEHLGHHQLLLDLLHHLLVEQRERQGLQRLIERLRLVVSEAALLEELQVSLDRLLLAGLEGNVLSKLALALASRCYLAVERDQLSVVPQAA
tara:strand:+ start:281 stop:631 length:351 start_codon:yes stop_codon:yes gene_type:complete